jgi:hypothetical protein
MSPPEMTAGDRSLSPNVPRLPDERSYWEALSADSHRPEVQEMIRREIRKRTVRVVPLPGSPDRVRLIPASPR